MTAVTHEEQATPRRRNEQRVILRAILRSKLAVIGIAILIIVFGFIISGTVFWHDSPNGNYSPINSPPSLSHPAGTDFLGHDLFSQIAWGSFPSLFIAIGGAFGSVILGLFAGVFAGYYTKLEGILGGVSDVTMAFPAVLLVLIIGSLFYPTNLLIMGLLVVVLWPPVARTIRAQVASVKRMAFIEAAKGSGLSDIQIVFREVIPEVGALAIAYFVLNVAIATVITAAVEFLGVGNPLQVSWGTILSFAQQYAFYLGDWWWIALPGLMITLTASGFAFFGYALEEIMNPRLRGTT